MCRRIRANHGRSRNGVLDDTRGTRRRRLHQLAGHRRRQHRDRPQRPVEKGPDARAGLEDRAGRLGHPDRRAADGDHQGRLPAAAVLRGHDARGVHGPRAHHDGDARHQRDPGRRRRGAGHRHLRRPPADAPPRLRQDLAPTRARCDSTSASATSPTPKTRNSSRTDIGPYRVRARTRRR